MSLFDSQQDELARQYLAKSIGQDLGNMRRLYSCLKEFFGEHKSCLTCVEHFDKEKEVCKLTITPQSPQGVRPPVEVIVKGCPAWSDIPF